MASADYNRYLMAAQATVSESIAPTTLKQYERCWKIWETFCSNNNIAVLGATDLNLIAYLAYVAEQHSDGVSTAYSHLSAVAYHYRVKGLPSISESNSVQMYMKGLKRRNIDKPVARAFPMSTDILHAMRQKLREGKPNLVMWRTAWRAHIEFALMLRFDDVKRLTRKQINFEENKTGKFIRLKLIGGKTILTKGNKKNEKLINYTGQENCLYTLTEQYLNFLGNHPGSLQPRCKPGQPNRPDPTKGIVYTLALSDLRNLITECGYDGQQYSEHSNKRGGASLAANNGMSEQEIAKEGDWSNVKTARLYIDEGTPLRQKRVLQIQKMI